MSEVPSKFFFCDELLDQIGDFLVIGSQIFELDKRFYSISSLTIGYLRL